MNKTHCKGQSSWRTTELRIVPSHDSKTPEWAKHLYPNLPKQNLGRQYRKLGRYFVPKQERDRETPGKLTGATDTQKSA